MTNELIDTINELNFAIKNRIKPFYKLSKYENVSDGIKEYISSLKMKTVLMELL